MTSTLLINIAPYRLGDRADTKQVADNIDLACRDIGFFLIKGH